MAASTAAYRAPSRPEIVLFHSVLGVRPSVSRWADRLRAAGYVAHVVDLYDGEVLDDYEPGFAYLDSIGGIPTLIQRTHERVVALPSDVVYLGFSNGAASAELLAAVRAGARGAVLMHGALPLELFELEAWPAAVPVQLHNGTADPFRDPEPEAAFVASVRAAGATVEAFEYEGAGHLFADEGMPEYDDHAEELMFGRVARFLEKIG